MEGKKLEDEDSVKKRKAYWRVDCQSASKGGQLDFSDDSELKCFSTRTIPWTALPGWRNHHYHHLLRHEGQCGVPWRNVLDLLRS